MKFTIMKLVLLFIYCIFPSSSYCTEDEIDDHWYQYKSEHEKFYHDEEEHERRQHFEESLRRLKEHNLEAQYGVHSYELELNHLSDRSPEEITSHTHCLHTHDEEEWGSFSDVTHDIIKTFPIPESVDWREKGMVTPVKNQGSCGACWAFAAIGALEGYVKRKKGELVPLSVQNLIDCATDDDGAHGCSGGTLKAGFEYLSHHGIDTEESYPYTGEGGTCPFSTDDVGVGLKRYGVKTDSEEHLLQLVAHFGPVASSIYASPNKFAHYSKGIYHDDECDGHKVNHAVLVVGYGEKNGRKYWIVKNSWGPNWGLDGYVLIERGTFKCSIGRNIVYAI